MASAGPTAPCGRTRPLFPEPRPWFAHFTLNRTRHADVTTWPSMAFSSRSRPDADI